MIIAWVLMLLLLHWQDLKVGYPIHRTIEASHASLLYFMAP